MPGVFGDPSVLQRNFVFGVGGSSCNVDAQKGTDIILYSHRISMVFFTPQPVLPFPFF